MKLELKHLAPYLPYGLQVQTEHVEGSRIYTLLGINAEYDRADLDNDYQWCYTKGIKPILRPISDLTKEIEINGKKFVPFNASSLFVGTNPKWFIEDLQNAMSWKIYQRLIEWHFDVFDLIEKGLAIDINTMQEKE